MGGQMNSKTLTVLVILTMLIVLVAGCFEKGVKKKPPAPVETEGTLETMSGWANASEEGESDEKGVYTTVDQSFSITINNTPVIEVRFTMRIEDYDSEHEDTDGNSPPDEVEITIKSAEYIGKAQGTTPCRLEIEPKLNVTLEEEEEATMPSSWEITIYAKCYSEITYPIMDRPSVIRGYVPDAGVAWTLEGEYIYLA
jgi:hypothetical protein